MTALLLLYSIVSNSWAIQSTARKIKCELIKLQQQNRNSFIRIKTKKKNAWVILFGVWSLFYKVTFLMVLKKYEKQEKVTKYKEAL